MQNLEDLPVTKYPHIPPMMEYFFDGTRDLAIFPPAVSLEPIDVDFGACPGPQTPNHVPLCLRNHTKGKVMVVWTFRSGCPFWVTPNTSVVPPLKSVALRLHFQPSSPNCLYVVELEAFAVYKVCAYRPNKWGKLGPPLAPEEQQLGTRMTGAVGPILSTQASLFFPLARQCPLLV